MKSARRILVAAAALTLSAGLSACGGDDSRDVANLEGSWVLVEFDRADIDAHPDVETTLDLEDGKATGSSGVNRFTGTYDAQEDGKVSFSDLAVTKMAGPETAMIQERLFLEEMAKVENFEYDSEDRQLELNDRADDTLLVFRRAD